MFCLLRETASSQYLSGKDQLNAFASHQRFRDEELPGLLLLEVHVKGYPYTELVQQ